CPAGCWQSLLPPSHSSRLQGLPSSLQAVPAVLFASAGQPALDPVQNSAGSHSPAEARQSAVVGRKASAGQEVLVPSQVSATSQSPAAGRHTAPAFSAGCWQSLLLPSHSSRLQGFPSPVQAVPLAAFESAGQSGPVPGQFSARSHSPAAARQTTLEGWKPSAGHAVLVPSQVSATSQSPAAARHTAPAFPAGCWQSSRLPSQVSVVHGFPSSVQAVPAACFASAGPSGPLPGQLSARSHSPLAARQTTLEGWKASAGQLLPAPSQVSTASQAPAEARQTAPAGLLASVGHAVPVSVQISMTSHSPAAAPHTAPPFPAGCGQSSPLPSHSSRLHGLPSSAHAVRAALFASAGHAALDPVHNSAGSHSPAEARQSVVAGRKVSA